MDDDTPDRAPDEAPPPQVFPLLDEALTSARRASYLTDVLRMQATLALWDAVVLQEEAEGLVVLAGGRAERAFGMHLAGILRVSRGRAMRDLHVGVALRGLPACLDAFLAGGFSWASAQKLIDNLGGLAGSAREAYDREAARLAEECTPQELDGRLTILHDELDADEATDRGAFAHRSRTVRARRGPAGSAEVVLAGSETDVAAVYETLHRVAVAAHGIPGEDRTVQQLMFDCGMDVLLGGLATGPAPDPADEGPGTPADPLERLGGPASGTDGRDGWRVPGRKAIAAEILVTVPAATACGASDAPGRISGWGSIPAAEVRRIVAASRFWTRVETDPVDDAILAFDSAERAIPAGLRRLIQARSGTCDEIGCPVGAHRTDIDHVIRVEHGGRTTEVNLSALCRPGHQTKDDGYVDVERTPDGRLRWRDRWGGAFTKRPGTTIRRRPDEDPGPAPWDTAA